MIFVCLLACIVAVNGRAQPSGPAKLVIDNDAGGDDAMAIFLALLYEKYFNGPQVVGLTTGNGNTNEGNVYFNNQRILKVAERQDVPIYRGSKSSLVTTPYASDYYGEDGLGDSKEVYTDLVPASNKDAVSALIELSKTHKDNLIVITIGTLTNVALAMKMDSNFLGRIGHLYIGAGHIHGENYPDPEINAHMDVEAYHIIAKEASPEKVTVFPFSQTMDSLNISKTWRLEVLGAIDSNIMKAQNIFEGVSIAKNEMWQALDPATVAIAVKPELVEVYKYSKNDIILCGDKRGMNTNSFVGKEDANVKIAYAVKLEEYKEFLLSVFSAT